MANTTQFTQLKKLSAKRNKLMDRVHGIDAQINSILEAVKVRGAVEKKDCPQPGSGPYKLCKVMSSRPKTKEEIAEKTGLSMSTVTAYLQQFNCFQSAGRGKRYIYKKPK